MSDFRFEDKVSLDNIIELKGVGQSYDGGQNWIIKDYNLIIEDKPAQGQFVVLLGMSGSGKSTILRYISALQEPTEGQVLVHGKPVGPDTHISMVFQQYSSLPWMTVLDNVGLALQYQGVSKKDRDEKAMELIKLVGLEGHEKKYAMYPTLSGGQLQRIAIARSLLANPDILLMDEPFGALDIKTRIQMQELLLELWEKFHSTVVFVTHDISEAVYLGDDIYIMKYAPSKIVEHISVDLPIHRTRETKRTPHFTQLVQHVEDTMMKISAEK
ncbi:MAG: ABC transporter ATP-binding protein [Saprospiraceae bacterium]|jgi:NitT/TauT family transport system ATP-binding protein|nr:ABC transporter ATP-binding protein [Saprospiraceae bacterium]MBK7699153.1 ABC transporter ATP-binding protein [Saprospiraceae bacterium]MBK8825446.1 ABC transporter ATP-binding protein [Saprospiraceae bacterium]MBP9056660.1 ABC transporter ATP-binding protein [Saprospiraceae bacterium]HMT53576.1 ABC transporter ATP-binding protein [Saprospiraceae bacterium]